MIKNMPPVFINFCGEVIPDSRLVKNLGVCIDSYLNYHGHLDAITEKCTGILISLNHSRHVIPKSAIRPIVEGLVISILRYGLSVYGTCGQEQLHRIQKLINFCVGWCRAGENTITYPMYCRNCRG